MFVCWSKLKRYNMRISTKNVSGQISVLLSFRTGSRKPLPPRSGQVSSDLGSLGVHVFFWKDQPSRHQQKWWILRIKGSTKMNQWMFESNANQDDVAFRSFPKYRLTVVTYGVVHLSGMLFGLFFGGWCFCQEMFRSNESKLIIHRYTHNLQQLARSFLFIVYLCISRFDLCNILDGSRHLLSLGSAKLSEENSGCNTYRSKNIQTKLYKDIHPNIKYNQIISNIDTMCKRLIWRDQFPSNVSNQLFSTSWVLSLDDSLGQALPSTVTRRDSGPIRIRKLAPGAPLRKSSALLRLAGGRGGYGDVSSTAGETWTFRQTNKHGDSGLG